MLLDPQLPITLTDALTVCSLIFNAGMAYAMIRYKKKDSNGNGYRDRELIVANLGVAVSNSDRDIRDLTVLANSLSANLQGLAATVREGVIPRVEDLYVRIIRLEERKITR